MQEEVENRTVNLAISTTKLTFRTIVNLLDGMVWFWKYQLISWDCRRQVSLMSLM